MAVVYHSVPLHVPVVVQWLTSILGWLVLLIARLALALYLVSSAMAAFDNKPLGALHIAIRIVLAVMIMAKPVEVYGVAVAGGIGIIIWHKLQSRQGGAPGAPIGKKAGAA